SESAGINFQRSLKFLPRLFCSAEFQQETSELFANRHERSGRDRMFAKNIFGIGRMTKNFERFIFLSLSRCNRSGRPLHLKIEVLPEIIELRGLRLIT